MKHRTKFWHLCTRLLPILLGVLAVGGLLLAAQPASAAGTCLADLAGSRLGCTAEDVAIAKATDICVPDGFGGCMKNPSCIEGSDVTFAANFVVQLQTKSTGGSQNRYDIGLWFATDGDPNGDGALTGQCVAATLPTGGGHDLDGDVCGDIDPAHSPVNVPLTITTKCQGVDDPSNPGHKILNLPAATSWKVPGGNTVCNDASQAVPSSSSKCKTQPGFTVNILVEEPGIAVVKTANPTKVDEPGGDVSFNVVVTNNGKYVKVTIDSLTDNPYGDITYPHDVIKSTGCSVPQPISPGNSYSCSFTVTVSGNPGPHTDTVTASGKDANGNPVQGSDDATVTIVDLPSSATLTKTPKSFVADVTFEVVVANTSPADTLTLTSLTDNKFGNITAAHPAGGGFEEVVSTTCNAGEKIAPSATYPCSFVGRISTSPHDNVVAAGLTDSYGNPVTPSPSDGASVVVSFP